MPISTECWRITIGHFIRGCPTESNKTASSEVEYEKSESNSHRPRSDCGEDTKPGIFRNRERFINSKKTLLTNRKIFLNYFFTVSLSIFAVCVICTTLCELHNIKVSSLDEILETFIASYNETDLVILLLRAGVEQNPGPPTGLPKKTSNQEHYIQPDNASTDNKEPIRTIRSLVEHLSLPPTQTNMDPKQNHAYYGIRLASFSSWPLARPTGMALTKAGFSYTGSSDIVECMACELLLGEWDQRGKPEEEHRRESPRCSFVLQEPGSDIRLFHDLEAEAIYPIASPDNQQLGGSELELRNTDHYSIRNEASQNSCSGSSSCEEDDSFVSQSHRGAIATIQSTRTEAESIADSIDGVGRNESDRHGGHGRVLARSFSPTFENSPDCQNPTFATYRARLDTYFDWPADKEQRPSQLADAGFLYIHMRDCVKCFFCNGVLNSWLPADNPWVEHAIWYPRCQYVIKMQGDLFVLQASNGDSPTPRAINNIDPGREVPHHSAASSARYNIGEAMLNPVALRALEMGFSRIKLQSAVESQLRETGRMFGTTDDLVEKLLNLNVTSPGTPSSSSSGSPHTPVHSAHVHNDVIMPSSSSTGQPLHRSDRHKQSKNKHLSQVKRLEKERAKLRKDNEKIERSRICSVCRTAKVAMLCLPCAHLAMCASCSGRNTTCPVCRSRVESTVRTYWE